MIVCIYSSSNNHEVLVGSSDGRFAEHWGSVVKIPVSALYADLRNIAAWCNCELNEECLFEMED